jgi:hypothetical protein
MYAVGYEVDHHPPILSTFSKNEKEAYRITSLSVIVCVCLLPLSITFERTGEFG